MRSVTVAICTFRRPDGLRRLLHELKSQVDMTSLSMRVVVVDNDPEATARTIVDGILARGYPYPVDYFVETRPGVAHARNRCLIESAGEYIAFIDDDEIPAENWLASLMKIQLETAADIVCGPVVPRFESTPPSWVLQGGFFNRRTFPDKTRIDWTDSRTGNVLFRREVVHLSGGEFDERFSSSGAEDALFFRRAQRRGASIYWSNKALVYEYIPDARMRLRWLLRRAYKGGQNWVRVQADSNRYIWLPMALRGLGAFLVFVVLFAIVAFVSRVLAIRLALQIAGNVGKMTAWWAPIVAYNRYTKRHYTG